jgi:hypothetical protein
VSWFDTVVYSAEAVGPWKMVSFLELRKAAAMEGLSPAEAEIYCLENGYVPSRYIRSMGTLGPDGQLRLLSSCAAVIGCGGLGGSWETCWPGRGWGASYLLTVMFSTKRT